MQLILNGQPKEFPSVRLVSDLVRALGMEHSPCAVEVNRALVPKSKHAQHELRDGDTVEVVTLVGGG